MSHHDEGVSRRGLLRTVGGAAAAGAVAGLSSTTGASGNDRKIVGLDGDANFGVAADAADSVYRRLDFGDVGKAVAGNFSDQALDRLRARGDVRYVEDDGTMVALGGPGSNMGPPGSGGGSSYNDCTPWGVDRTDADVAAANGDTGTGAEIAIIDTGIDPDHPDLNVAGGKAFVECKGGSKECDGEKWADDEGHGSHCAGTAGATGGNGEGVEGVATDPKLYAIKVLDKRGSGSFSDVADGIRYTANQGYDVGSMSLGASSGSQAVKDACTYAYNNGVLLVAAAGNDGPCSGCVGYPAAYSEVIAVSATEKDDTLASYSSTGSAVELAAPGSDVLSTYDDGGYDTLSGTSMACPHVSGAGGILMAQGASNSNARSTLKNNAEDIGLSSNEQGAGLLDVAAALGLDSSDDGTGDC